MKNKTFGKIGAIKFKSCQQIICGVCYTRVFRIYIYINLFWFYRNHNCKSCFFIFLQIHYFTNNGKHYCFILTKWQLKNTKNHYFDKFNRIKEKYYIIRYLLCSHKKKKKMHVPYSYEVHIIFLFLILALACICMEIILSWWNPFYICLGKIWISLSFWYKVRFESKPTFHNFFRTGKSMKCCRI